MFSQTLRRAWVVFCFATFLSLRLTAAPRLINVDYGAHQNPSFSIKTGVAAVGNSPSDYWNLYSRDDGFGGFRSTGTLQNLLWNDQTSSGASLEVNNAPGAWFTFNTDPMFESYLYPAGGGVITSTLMDLPAGSFDLYVYAHGQPAGENSVIEVKVGNSMIGSKATSAAADWDSPGWGESRQYVLFSNISVPAGQSLTILSRPGVADLAVVNGIQLLFSQEVSPPGPSLQITTQPQSKTVVLGQSVIFSVEAVGSGTLHYQWYHNGASIFGATEAAYRIASASPENVGTYQVIVTDDLKVVVSEGAALTVGESPTLRITLQPESLSIHAGENATFSVEAEGPSPLTYQWQRNAVNIAGATERTLSLGSVAAEQAGHYRVVVSAGSETIISAEASLDVLPVNSTPTLLLNINYGAHQNPNFSVKTGAAAIGKAGDVWNLYSRDDGLGGFRPNGVLSDLVWSDGARSTIDLAVTNAAGAWYTFRADPMFQSYLYPLGGGPNIVSVLSDLPPGSYDFYIYAHGQPPEENGVVELLTDGTSYGIKRTSTAANWDSPDWSEGNQYVLFRGVRVILGDRVIIRSLPGSSGLAVINGLQAAFTPSSQQLEIVRQPIDQSVFVGETATFSVTAVSSGQLRFQWFKDRQLIPGATESVLSIPGATLEQAGTYGVSVSDGATTVSSVSARLIVQVPPPSSGRILNVNYTAHLNPNFAVKSGAAAVGSAGDYWNVYSRDNLDGSWRDDGTVVGLKWNTGETTAAELSVSNAQGAWYTQNFDAMFQSYLYPISRAGPITSQIKRLPAGAYNLYVYAHGLPASENAEIGVTVGSRSYGMKSTSALATWNTPGWTEGGEYVVFRNVQIGSGEILQIVSRGGASGLAVMNGWQLVRSEEAPDPSSLNDGIPDSWRLRYFSSISENAAAAIADPDNDGANNYQEFLDGTDPLTRDVGGLPIRVETYAGSVQGNVDGPLATAQFSNPATLTLHEGRIYVTQTDIPGFWSTGPQGHSIRLIENGMVTTWAGSLEPGLVEGPRLEARFRGPTSIVFDSHGNAFVSDRLNHRIRKINRSGTVSTFAGSNAGFQDGMGVGAQFRSPIGMCIDSDDNLYVADFENYRVRKINPAGEVSTYAGTGAEGATDGFRTSASFASPHFVAIAPDRTLYIADWLNGRVRRVAPDGMVSTIDTGRRYIEGVATDDEGNCYASIPPDLHRLIKYRPDGTIEWQLGNTPGYLDGPAEVAQFRHFGIPLVLEDGNILITDGDHHIRRIVTARPVEPLLQISPQSGTFYGQVEVSMRARGNGTIRYTVDGSEPSNQSTAYNGPINLLSSGRLRARLFVNGTPVSDIITAALQVQPRGNLDLLNVDFTAHLNPNFSRKAGIAAIGNSPQDFWNVYSRDGANGEWLANNEVSNLKWSDERPSSIRLSVRNAAGAWYTLNADPMFQSYLYPLGRSGDIQAQFTKLPPGTYDLYVYAHGQPPAENASILVSANGRTVGPKLTSSAANWDQTVWREEGQFVEFSDIAVGADGALTIVSKPGVSGLAVINGLQLVFKSGNVPPFDPTIADWTFEEGVPGDEAEIIKDFSGHEHDSSRSVGHPKYVLSSPAVAGFTSLQVGETNADGFVSGPSVDFSPGSEFTIEVLGAAIKSNTENQTILALQNSETGRFLYDLQHDPIAKTIRFVAFSQSGNPFTLTMPFPADGASHHIAVVYKRGEVSLYLDKVFAAGGSCSAPDETQFGSAVLAFVGANPSGEVRSFRGVLDRVRLSATALQPEQFFETRKDAGTLVIVRHLQDNNARAGASLSFSVTASSSQPLSYQWFFNGQLVLGAAESTLRLENVQVSAAGTYSVTVTAADGQQASSRAQLTVESAPAQGLPKITRPPASLTVNFGEPILLSVAAEGDALTYQWLLDGAEIFGATSEVYAVPAASARDSGAYEVRVGNTAGSVLSSAATVTVIDTVPPVVTITSPAGPTDQSRYTLSGFASDNSGEFRLEWLREGQTVMSVITTNGPFAFGNIQLETGTNRFAVRVSDSNGNSSVANVVVVLNPSRSFSLPDGTVVQEGERFRLPVQVTSQGEIGAVTFEIKFDTNYLTEASFIWNELPSAALGEANASMPGVLRASLVLGGEAFPPGERTLGFIELRLRSIPTSLESSLELNVIGIYSPAGEPITSGTLVRSGTVKLLAREIKGDNNANDRLDVGDASVMLRFVTQIDAAREWDIAANDLNGNGSLDAGDVVRALRAAAAIDPQPVMTARLTRQSVASPATPGAITVVSDHANLRGVDHVTVRISLTGAAKPVSGTSFKIEYPASALQLENSSSHLPGRLVPSTALVVWNVSPEKDNYSTQDGMLYGAFSSPTYWEGATGELAVLQFKVLPAALAQPEWHIRVSEVQVAAGIDVSTAAPAELILTGDKPRKLVFEKIAFDGGSFHFEVAGEPNTPYRVEVSPDLFAWSWVGNYSDPSGRLSITDHNPLKFKQRYYRVVKVP